jgi:hypothetical protein
VQPSPYVAARHGASRYHLPGCHGLGRSYDAGNVAPITRAAILTQHLLPCALCTTAGMRQVPILAVV